jgi:hypothetical protein
VVVAALHLTVDRWYDGATAAVVAADSRHAAYRLALREGAVRCNLRFALRRYDVSSAATSTDTTTVPREWPTSAHLWTRSDARFS